MQNKLSHILSICWKFILPIKSSTRSGTDIPGQIFLWSSCIEGNTRSILVWKSRALELMKSLKMRVETREESHRVWEALPSIGTATSTLRHCPRAEIEIFMAERRMTDPLQPSGNKILVSGVDTNIITIILSAHPTNQNTPKDVWQRKIKYPQIGNCWNYFIQALCECAFFVNDSASSAAGRRSVHNMDPPLHDPPHSKKYWYPIESHRITHETHGNHVLFNGLSMFVLSLLTIL